MGEDAEGTGRRPAITRVDEAADPPGDADTRDAAATSGTDAARGTTSDGPDGPDRRDADDEDRRPGAPRSASNDGPDWDDLTPAVTRHEPTPDDGAAASTSDVPEDVRSYERFSKIDGATYERANRFLRDRTYITAREWAMARLCADFRTETGVEMTKIGENLPELVPFMTDTYTPQAVNQARSSFDDKVRKAGATFLYGAMCDFYTAEELDDLMYEVTEVAKFLLEVEGVELSVDEELAAEDRISSVMREVRESSMALRHDHVTCPECGHEIGEENEAAGNAGARADD